MTIITSKERQLNDAYDAYADMLYHLALSHMQSKEDAEDVIQEVFCKYYIKMPSFTDSAHEKAWFIRVTTNLCKNLWKSAWRQKMVSMDSLEETQEGNAYIQQSLNEEEELLVETVKRLPFKYRIVVHLFYYEEMSLEEIATALKLKSSNVRTRLTRARKMLREWLKEDV